MENKKVVLVVEDEQSICRFVSVVLETNGYLVETAGTGEEAINKCRVRQPSVLLLDLGLPDMDGVQVMKKMRERYSFPVVVVSARTGEKDKAEVLSMGADAYITKPFGTQELIDCVKRAERYSKQGKEQFLPKKTRIQTGEFTLDLEKECALVRGQDIGLTHMEFILLSALVKKSGRVLTYEFLMEEVWKDTSLEKARELRTLMAGLRKKLEENPMEPCYIFAEIGVGYRFRDI